MKKILFFMPFLVSIIYADANTSGNLQLLLPTVGSVDANRSYGSKLNANFSIIDSSFTTLTNNINTSTANITSAFNNFTSTVQTRIDNLQTFTSTAQTRIDNLQTFTSTAQSVIDSHTSTITALSNSTNTLINAGKNNSAVITSTMTNGSLIQAGSGNSGVIFSSMTTGLATSITPRTYTLYVGTPGTPNVDTIVGGSASFDAMFASVAAHGLTLSDTAQATIFINPGVYQVSNATIPAGITIVCGSSVVFTPTDNATSIMTVYGKISNAMVDMQNRVFVGPAILAKSHANIDNIRVTTGSADTTVNTTVFLVQFATDVAITGVVDSFAANANVNLAGGLLNVQNSTNVYVNLKTKDSETAGGNNQSIYVSSVTNFVLTGNYDNVGGRFLTITGNNVNAHVSGYYHINRKWVRLMEISQGYSVTSTGTVLDNMIINDEYPANFPLITMHGDVLGDAIYGLLIVNCVAFTNQLGVNAPNFFIDIGNGGNTFEFTCVVANSHCFGMPFLTDAGNGTIYKDMANSQDGKNIQ